jgi:hypothetical protein
MARTEMAESLSDEATPSGEAVFSLAGFEGFLLYSEKT